MADDLNSRIGSIIEDELIGSWLGGECKSIVDYIISNGNNPSYLYV